MKIGIFSTFADQQAYDLVDAVSANVRNGTIPESEISFVLSNREFGESKETDELLRRLLDRRFPLEIVSAAKFDPEGRRLARAAERAGDDGPIRDWRNRFGEEVQSHLPETDVDLLLGDMWIWGENLARERNGMNLHPALPGGPKGEWYRVIWNVIARGETIMGLMMHRVTEDLDSGPPISFVQFSIIGSELDQLWDQLPSSTERLAFISKELTLRERSRHPLFLKIREYGMAREIPLVVQTTKALAEGRVSVEGGNPIDLTEEIDGIVHPQLEGAGRRAAGPEGPLARRREVIGW